MSTDPDSKAVAREAEPSFCLHASSAAFDGRAVLFTGDSGAGKTTALELIRGTGRHAFGDELAVCTLAPGGRWMLSDAASTRGGKLTCAPEHVAARIALLVHLQAHLERGFALRPCSALESVVRGYRSVIEPGQHLPAVRAHRFRLFSQFARAVPAAVLDFSLRPDFVAAVEARIKEGVRHDN